MDQGQLELVPLSQLLAPSLPWRGSGVPERAWARRGLYWLWAWGKAEQNPFLVSCVVVHTMFIGLILLAPLPGIFTSPTHRALELLFPSPSPVSPLVTRVFTSLGGQAHWLPSCPILISPLPHQQLSVGTPSPKPSSPSSMGFLLKCSQLPGSWSVGGERKIKKMA